MADGGTQDVSDGSLWGVGSIGVVDGGRRVVCAVSLQRCVIVLLSEDDGACALVRRSGTLGAGVVAVVWCLV